MTAYRSKLVLIGAGPTALSALQSLTVDCDVLAVFRAGGSSDPVCQYASQKGIPVESDLTPGGITTNLKRLRPDCVVISSYNRIVGPEMLSVCPFINVHYSSLPRYRGRANVNWAIINGESDVAISIHVVVPGLDAGNILFQRTVPIGDDTTVADIYGALNDIQRKCLGSVVRDFLGGYAGTSQDESNASYCCTRLPADGEVDWRQPTQAICNLVRALQPPYPYAYTFLNGTRLALIRAEMVASPRSYVGRIPGRVVGIDRRAGTVDVLTGDGVLRVAEVGFEGCAAQTAASVITSTKDSLGLYTRDLLLRVEQLERQVQGLSAELRAMQMTTI